MLNTNGQVEWKLKDGVLQPYLPAQPDVKVVFAPMPGSQQAFLNCPATEVLLEGNRGGGKGLRNDQDVWTPGGPRPIGDLEVGDVVCTANGGTSTILGVFPQGQRPCYRITFDDGAQVVCDDQHLWPILDTRTENATQEGYRLRTMRQVWDDYNHTKKSLRIPMAKPVHLNVGQHATRAMDPYILGLLMGDGCFSSHGDVLFSTHDDELAGAVTALGMKERKPDTRSGHRSFAAPRAGILWAQADALKLIKTARIPKELPAQYLYAPTNVRLSVLRGLMDTDGTVKNVAQATFVNTSLKLCEQVQFLTRSLGGKATIKARKSTAKHHKDAWDVVVKPCGNFNPFRIHRKAKRMDTPKRRQARRIKTIEELPPAQTTCIKIDEPNGLFLTNDFIVTHNTTTLIMDFAQHVGQGFGSAWTGILFRQTFPQLQDVIRKTLEWFPKIWPDAKYNRGQHIWTWPGGETLYMAQAKVVEDYLKYHGWNLQWIGWEELTNWATPELYLKMFSTLRSSDARVKPVVRATTNPSGPGHHWVKKRFSLPTEPGKLFTVTHPTNVEDNPFPRVAIKSSLSENKSLMLTDPGYRDRILASADTPEQRRAWDEGDWNIVSGGMFTDVWDPTYHVLPDLPYDLIPIGWRIDRSYDHGQSKPFAVQWWAESNGESIEYNGRVYGPVKGDIICINEWYGWTGEPNKGLRMPVSEIAKGIKEREERMFPDNPYRIKAGVADSSIFDRYQGDKSVAGDFMAARVNWIPCVKGPGSRIQGWTQARQMLKNGIPEAGHRELPGLFVTAGCQSLIRTLPVAERDSRNHDDLDTNSEDHSLDCARYRVYRRKNTTKSHDF